MKLADLQRAAELQQALARLDEMAAGSATLTIDGVGVPPIMLNADELAAFLDWKREQITAELRRLGVETGDGNTAGGRGQRPGVARNQATAGATPPPATRPRPAPLPAPAPPKTKRLTPAQATAEARRRILGPIERELRANGGYLDDEAQIGRDLAAMAEKRVGDIAELARELMRGPPPPAACTSCGAPANTVIDGRNYCAKHAKTASRPAAPELAA